MTEKNELKQAKQALEENDYERKLVYKVAYMKQDRWFYTYFENRDDAYVFIDAMERQNGSSDDRIYKYITLNRFSWEMFIEP